MQPAAKWTPIHVKLNEEQGKGNANNSVPPRTTLFSREKEKRAALDGEKALP